MICRCILLVSSLLIPSTAASSLLPGQSLEEGRLVATGATLPRHLAVEAFFEKAVTLYRAGEATFDYSMLGELGIMPHS